jgi:hypothetical protein
MLFKYILVNSLKYETWVLMTLKESYGLWRKPKNREKKEQSPVTFNKTLLIGLKEWEKWKPRSQSER